MADNKDEEEEPTTRGNEWEVVSLSASTYAAAPCPEQVDVTDYEKGDSAEEIQANTSLPLFMSGHFVFPPSQHENLPLEPENVEIHSAQEGEDSSSHFLGEDEIGSDAKELEMINTKGLTIRDEFLGIPIFDEKGNILAVGSAEFEEGAAFQGLNLVEKEQSFYESGKFCSHHDDPTIGVSANADDETALTKVIDQTLDSSISSLSQQRDKDSDVSGLPCEAWWKRRAASFYAHAKDANTVWSVFVAAAVMGLVILGQRWQQERWEILQQKWQLSINNERMGRLFGPLIRMKDVIVGGQQRGSFIRGGT